MCAASRVSLQSPRCCFVSNSSSPILYSGHAGNLSIGLRDTEHKANLFLVYCSARFELRIPQKGLAEPPAQSYNAKNRKAKTLPVLGRCKATDLGREAFLTT